MSIKCFLIGHGVVLNKNKVIKHFKDSSDNNLKDDLDDDITLITFEQMIEDEKLTMFYKDDDILIMANPVLINKKYTDIGHIPNHRANIDYNTYVKFVKLVNYLPMDYEKMNEKEKDKFNHAMEYVTSIGDLIIFKTKINTTDVTKYYMV